MVASREIRFGDCWVVINGSGAVLTTFADGMALDSRSYPTLALACSFLANKEGKPYSPLLWRKAHPFESGPAFTEELQREEVRALILARFAETGEGRWDAVTWLGGYGIDLDDLAAEFKAITANA